MFYKVSLNSLQPIRPQHLITPSSTPAPQKNKICIFHANEPEVGLGPAAAVMGRFCQKCMRFHELPDFDGLKKSCRRSLLAHSKNRKRAREQGRADEEAKAAAARSGAPDHSPRGAPPAAQRPLDHGRPLSHAASSAALALETPHASTEIAVGTGSGPVPSFADTASPRSESHMPRVCSTSRTGGLTTAMLSPRDASSPPGPSYDPLVAFILGSGPLSAQEFAALPPVVSLPEECGSSLPPEPSLGDLFGSASQFLMRASEALLSSTDDLHPDLLKVTLN